MWKHLDFVVERCQVPNKLNLFDYYVDRKPADIANDDGDAKISNADALNSARTLMDWCKIKMDPLEFEPYATCLSKLINRINQGIFIFKQIIEQLQ